MPWSCGRPIMRANRVFEITPRRRGASDMSDGPNTISRREFTALSIAAGVAAATGASGATAKEMIDSDVQVTTAAGVCDAALIHPRDGSWPAAILFTDVFGLRPTMRDMAKRLAA